ncbi:MAG: dienelactone hydrolase family protein [Chloroflexi bacterium]|jgi:carboxymethylenebutenolidase|nr:dienelactone hydrolase family protein [Chloroflexota bacterium]MCZ6708388.1 dienelactone hydrolase family protein [Chloroflexota bacterium]
MVTTTSDSIDFAANGGTASGYLAYPTEGGPYPGVVVIQEWWGLNDNIKDIANRIAAEGYVAVAPDLYHGEVADEPDLAQKLMMAMVQEQATKDMNGAVAALQARDDVVSDRIGTTGFCMGGGLALLLHMQNGAVKASAPFYGVPMGDLADCKNIQGGVLGIYAGLDGFVTQEYVDQVGQALNDAGVPNEIVVYPEADHGFFNDTSDVFKADDASDSWEKLKTFFASNLKS